MTLSDLITNALGQRTTLPDLDLDVTGVAQDNRKIGPGMVFVARSGELSDGHDYAEDAVERGAVAIVGERELERLANVPYIHTDNAKKATAKLAAAFWRTALEGDASSRRHGYRR